MKKVKGKMKIVTAFIIEEIIVGSIVGVTAYVLSTQEIGYINTQSGLQSTNVQAAIDELYTKAENARLPIDSNTFRTNSAKTVYASSKGVCIKRNNKLNCFKV